MTVSSKTWQTLAIIARNGAIASCIGPRSIRIMGKWATGFTVGR